jgi:type I restriction enzyme S subunit
MEVKPGYKSTEMGIIPADWDVLRLGDMADVVTSGSRGWARFYSESGALFIRSQNVRDVHLCFEDVQYVSPPSGAEGNRTRVSLNDLLITVTGNSVGNVAFVEQEFEEAYISQHVGLVRLKEPSRAPYVCRYLSPHSPGNPQIAGSQSGQSKPGLNLQNLKDFRVATPRSADELQSIATVFADVDTLLGTLERLIAKKRDLKQAAMQQLLTGQTRLPGFGGEWLSSPLGKCCEVVMGQSPPGHSYNRRGSGTPLINGPTEFTDKHPVRIQWTTEPTRFCKRGDLLLCVRGSSTGRTNVADDAYCIGRGVAAIRALGTHDTNFLSYQVIAGVDGILAASAGSTFPSVDATSLRRITIPLPPTTREETSIAEVLSHMDAEIDALEARLTKTRDFKQGMMQELLTGRTRLV